MKQFSGSPRILVIRRRYMGDLVMISPVITNLKRHYPQGHITLLVDEKYEDVHAHNPDLDETYCIPQRQPNENLFGYMIRWVKLLVRLRKKFDIVYDFTRNSRVAYLIRWMGASHRVGFMMEDKPHKRDRLYNVLAVWTRQDDQTRHIVDFCLSLLEADNIPIVTREVKLHALHSDVAEAREYLQSTLKAEQNQSPKSTFVFVHPGARLADRCWPAKNYAAICDVVQNKTSAAVFILGGPGEKAWVQEVRDNMRSTVRVLNAPPSVPKLAALLQAADLLLCNDSGPMHVAAAVGTPVVALFGAQPIHLWRPAGENNTLLQASMPCGSHCLYPGICEPPNNYKMRCIQRISIDAVTQSVLGQLDEMRCSS